MGLAHFAFDLCPGHQRRHTIDGYYIDGSAADQCFCYLKGLFPCIRLRDQQVIQPDPTGSGIGGIKSMLHVYICSHATVFLGFGQYMLA